MLFLSGHAENAEMGESREFLYPSVSVWSPLRNMSNYCIFNLLSNDCVCVLFHFGYISAPAWAAGKGEKTADNPQTWNFQNYPETVLREQQKVQILIGSDLLCPTVCISLCCQLLIKDGALWQTAVAQHKTSTWDLALCWSHSNQTHLNWVCPEVPRERWAPCTAHGNEESGSPKICNWYPKARADN